MNNLKPGISRDATINGNRYQVRCTAPDTYQISDPPESKSPVTYGTLTFVQPVGRQKPYYLVPTATRNLQVEGWVAAVETLIAEYWRQQATGQVPRVITPPPDTAPVTLTARPPTPPRPTYTPIPTQTASPRYSDLTPPFVSHVTEVRDPRYLDPSQKPPRPIFAPPAHGATVEQAPVGWVRLAAFAPPWAGNRSTLQNWVTAGAIPGVRVRGKTGLEWWVDPSVPSPRLRDFQPRPKPAPAARLGDVGPIVADGPTTLPESAPPPPTGDVAAPVPILAAPDPSPQAAPQPKIATVALPAPVPADQVPDSWLSNVAAAAQWNRTWYQIRNAIYKGHVRAARVITATRSGYEWRVDPESLRTLWGDPVATATTTTTDPPLDVVEVLHELDVLGEQIAALLQLVKAREDRLDEMERTLSAQNRRSSSTEAVVAYLTARMDGLIRSADSVIDLTQGVERLTRENTAWSHWADATDRQIQYLIDQCAALSIEEPTPTEAESSKGQALLDRLLWGKS